MILNRKTSCFGRQAEIDENSIVLIEGTGRGNYSVLTFENGKTLVFTRSLKEINNRADGFFLRINQSLLVNSNKIKSIDFDGKNIKVLDKNYSISRRQFNTVKQILTAKDE